MQKLKPYFETIGKIEFDSASALVSEVWVRYSNRGLRHLARIPAGFECKDVLFHFLPEGCEGVGVLHCYLRKHPHGRTPWQVNEVIVGNLKALGYGFALRNMYRIRYILKRLGVSV